MACNNGQGCGNCRCASNGPAADFQPSDNLQALIDRANALFGSLQDVTDAITDEQFEEIDGVLNAIVAFVYDESNDQLERQIASGFPEQIIPFVANLAYSLGQLDTLVEKTDISVEGNQVTWNPSVEDDTATT